MKAEARERQLAVEVGRGGRDALAALYEEYAEAVYRIGYRISGNEADAEDVVQDVFLGLPRAIRTFEGRGSLEGWIRRVTVRTALMRLRVSRRQAEVPLGVTALSDRSSTSRVADRLTIEDAMARLSDSLREVFVLKEMEGYSHHEIGEMLGITASASEVRLHRARKQLRKLLEHST